MNPNIVAAVIVVTVTVLIFWAVALSTKRVAQNIAQLAASLGLDAPMRPPALGIFYREPRASGVIRGKQVEIFSFSTGSGKSRVQWSAVSAAPKRDGGLTFHIRKQGFGTKVMEMFGSKEIEVGDPEFDRQWFIQTNQPDYLRAALLPEVRDRISSLGREPAGGLQLKLEAGVVRYAERGTFAQTSITARIGRAVPVVCDLADLAEVFAER